jgi:hypothetical protein
MFDHKKYEFTRFSLQISLPSAALMEPGGFGNFYFPHLKRIKKVFLYRKVGISFSIIVLQMFSYKILMLVDKKCCPNFPLDLDVARVPNVKEFKIYVFCRAIYVGDNLYKIHVHDTLRFIYAISYRYTGYYIFP